MTRKQINRRGLLKAAAGLAVLTLSPGVTLIAIPEAAHAEASPRKRWGLLIDASKCAETCTGCIDACASENGWKAGGDPLTDSQWARKVTTTDRTTGAERSFPVMCQHCAEPPCVQVCPTGASFKRADGVVLVDKHICIGCRYCMMACPYKARSFVHHELEDQKPDVPRGMGTVEGCTLCVHRIDKGQPPACVEACAKMTGAMIWGDLNDPNSEISRRLAKHGGTAIRADLGLNPGVRYQNI
jgi:molybdopterin-containing oxidoreductase family iron-sulfur binding subunit